MIHFGVNSTKVHDGLIDHLRATESAVQSSLAWLYIQGEQIRLTDVIFVDIEEVYQMANVERCVMVLIELLSKQVRVRVAPANLHKVSAEASTKHFSKA